MSPSLAEIVAFRPMAPGDVNFVLDSWLRSYRESPWAGCTPNNVFFQVYHEAIEGLLARGAKVEVACAKHDPDKILGWICSEAVKGGSCVHFTYIKDPYRRMGLATELIDRNAQENRRFYTFRTKGAEYCRCGQFSPEIARRK